MSAEGIKLLLFFRY